LGINADIRAKRGTDMRIAHTLCIAAVLMAATGGTTLAQTYTAALDGLQETPPNASPAIGGGTFSLDAAKVLHYSISFSGLTATETAAHIHGPAAAGVPAPVLFPLPLGSPIAGTIGPLTAAQEADLNAGLYYVNVHDSNFPGGEIRGQIYRDVVGVAPSTWGAVKDMFR
jgi:hypothetical protein